MATTIRPMQKSDLQRLAEIYVKVYKKFDVGERWNIESAKRLLSYWLRRQPDLALVAEYDGKVVGAFLAGVKPWWDGNHLVDGEVFVHPDFQRKGVGKELSRAMYRLALKKYKVKSFDTTTFKKKEFPLSWYRSQGFEVNKDWVLISGDVKAVLSRLKKK